MALSVGQPDYRLPSVPLVVPGTREPVSDFVHRRCVSSTVPRRCISTELCTVSHVCLRAWNANRMAYALEEWASSSAGMEFAIMANHKHTLSELRGLWYVREMAVTVVCRLGRGQSRVVRETLSNASNYLSRLWYHILAVSLQMSVITYYMAPVLRSRVNAESPSQSQHRQTPCHAQGIPDDV